MEMENHYSTVDDFAMSQIPRAQLSIHEDTKLGRNTSTTVHNPLRELWTLDLGESVQPDDGTFEYKNTRNKKQKVGTYLGRIRVRTDLSVGTNLSKPLPPRPGSQKSAFSPVMNTLVAVLGCLIFVCILASIILGAHTHPRVGFVQNLSDKNSSIFWLNNSTE